MVGELIVQLEEREIPINKLPDGNYLYMFKGQTFFTYPRKSRQEIIKIAEKNPERRLILETADLKFKSMYKKMNRYKKQKIQE